MEKITININQKTILITIVVLVVASLAFLVGQYTKQGESNQTNTSDNNESSQTDSSAIMAQINPPEGYEINAVYGDVGPKLIESGVIDLEKFKGVYQRSGQPLTQEQLDILTKGSNEKIKITPENSYFLLNFLWAVGLANKNKILDQGPMQTSGTEVGNFASTGGWTLAKSSAVNYYSKYQITKALSASQQSALEDFAYNSYRPCCGNPTGFPDCNHGMAMLGLGEIMASQGVSADDMFNAFKYVNAFWFPQTYFDIATYFKAKEGKDYKDVDARTIAGADYSSGSARLVEQWLSGNNLKEQAPSSGGGCGV